MKPISALYLAGIVMVVSGLVHSVIWMATGESWEGQLSIRKPILFGVSTGITLLSLGWIQQKLKPVRYDRWLSLLLAGSLLVEVGLITLQYWRGEESHFNLDSPLNFWIDRSITFLIVIAAIAIFDIGRRSFLSLDATASMRLAIRAGMAFLLISCGLGFFILFYGEHMASLGQSPTRFGKAGVLKFPHGITIHAVQYLPLFVWAMAWLRIPLGRQVPAVRYATASLAIFLVFSLWQTFNGLDRFDFGLLGGMILGIAVGCAAAAVIQSALGLKENLQPSVSNE